MAAGEVNARVASPCGDALAAGSGSQRVPSVSMDGLGDEDHSPVGQDDLGAAGMVAAERQVFFVDEDGAEEGIDGDAGRAHRFRDFVEAAFYGPHVPVVQELR